ncbi:MAG: thiamine phosphate synthase [Myxococcales bacterium]|nr:thiamine phosphate synthase [Myxococcales bacterium]
MSRVPFDLLLLTDPAAPLGVVASIARALDAAGSPRVAVQLRDKAASTRALLAAGRALRQATSRAGATLLVNGRLDIAVAVGADGVHLGEAASPVSDVRRLLGARALIGASRHDAAGVREATAAGADFIVVAPFAEVPRKGPPLGREGLAALVRETPLPVFALGGVGPESVALIRDAGARGVAVLRGVGGSRDPAARALAYRHSLDSARICNELLGPT